MESTQAEPKVIVTGRAARLRRDLVPLYALTATVLCAAGGWYLLKELAPLLRPLTLAVFLAYTILPAHRALRRRVDTWFAGPLLALLLAAVVLGLAVVIYGNLVDLKEELPRLIERGRGLIERLRTWGRGHLPAWMLDPAPNLFHLERKSLSLRSAALISSFIRPSRPGGERRTQGGGEPQTMRRTTSHCRRTARSHPSRAYLAAGPAPRQFDAPQRNGLWRRCPRPASGSSAARQLVADLSPGRVEDPVASDSPSPRR